MTERNIQLMLMRHYRSSWVCACPNYTPIGWWECDLWAVTKAGYAVEYEIKLTVSDFRADQKKGRNRWLHEGRRYTGKTREVKHEMIGDTNGPTRFFYVVSSNIEAAVKDELPEWAGLIVADEDHWLICEVVRAPRLHRTKINKREIRLAMTRMWYRYWQTLETRQDEQRR